MDGHPQPLRSGAPERQSLLAVPPADAPGGRGAHLLRTAAGRLLSLLGELTDPLAATLLISPLEEALEVCLNPVAAALRGNSLLRAHRLNGHRQWLESHPVDFRLAPQLTERATP